MAVLVALAHNSNWEPAPARRQIVDCVIKRRRFYKVKKKAQSLESMIKHWAQTLQRYFQGLTQEQAIDVIKRSTAFYLAQNSGQIWSQAQELAKQITQPTQKEVPVASGVAPTPKGQKMTEERKKYLQDATDAGNVINMTIEEMQQLSSKQGLRWS